MNNTLNQKNISTECFIGTSGWDYSDWQIIFYPEKIRNYLDKLRFYSQFFDYVEIESTFYNLYTSDIAKSLIENVKDNKKFLFSLKLNSFFTYGDNYNKSDLKKMLEFINIFASNNKLDSVLLHFPQSFINTKENRAKLYKLNRVFENFRLVVDLKNTTWHSPLTYNFLEENKFHLCITDNPLEVNQNYYENSVLGRYCYIHLNGRNIESWLGNNKRDKYDYFYSNSELYEMNKKIEKLNNKTDKVIIIFNNYPNGKSISNAFSLLSFIKKRPILIPEQTVYYFSNLKSIAYRVNTNRLPLFQ